MKLYRFFAYLALIALFFVSFTGSSTAQVGGGVTALVKGTAMSASGGTASDVTITVYKGTESIRTTKVTPEGKFTIVLKPGVQYRITFASTSYYFHEEQLNIQASDKFQEVPMSVTLKELELGKPYLFNDLIFEPKSTSISPNVMSDLENIASAVRRNPKLSLSITVYPDETPSGKKAAVQNGIAASRKSALLSFFSSKNIPASNIIIDVSSTVPAGGKFQRMVLEDQPAAAKGKKKKKAVAVTPAAKQMMVPQYAQIVMRSAS